MSERDDLIASAEALLNRAERHTHPADLLTVDTARLLVGAIRLLCSQPQSPVYVAIFTRGRFYRLEPQLSREAAEAYAEGVRDCADHLDETERVRAYVMPLEGIVRVDPVESEKAQQAWARAAQEDDVARQKDGW